MFYYFAQEKRLIFLIAIFICNYYVYQLMSFA